MDQSVEAVLSMAVFSIMLAITSSLFLGMFASVAAKELQLAEGNEAALVSSAIVLQNNSSANLWRSWSPSAAPQDYGLPATLHITVNATALTVDGGALVTLWSKTTGTPPANSGAESQRLIPLDDGSAVLLVVVVW